MTVPRIFGVTLALTGVLVLAVGISNGGASTKFAYTAEVTETGNAVVQFEEGSMKRFEAVDYELTATVTSFWVSPCGGQAIQQTFPIDTVSLVPDARGRVTGTLTLGLEVPGIVCPVLQRVEYTSVLTNLTTGHAYRLDPFSRDFP